MATGSAPETWITCGTILYPSLFPILSRSTRAAQVVRAASPRATRMIQRCVAGEKYLTVCRKQRAQKREISLALFPWSRRQKRTSERGTDFSPARISKVQQYALFQRVKDVLS